MNQILAVADMQPERRLSHLEAFQMLVDVLPRDSSVCDESGLLLMDYTDKNKKDYGSLRQDIATIAHIACSSQTTISRFKGVEYVAVDGQSVIDAFAQTVQTAEDLKTAIQTFSRKLDHEYEDTMEGPRGFNDTMSGIIYNDRLNIIAKYNTSLKPEAMEADAWKQLSHAQTMAVRHASLIFPDADPEAWVKLSDALTEHVAARDGRSLAPSDESVFDYYMRYPFNTAAMQACMKPANDEAHAVYEISDRSVPTGKLFQGIMSAKMEAYYAAHAPKTIDDVPADQRARCAESLTQQNRAHFLGTLFTFGAFKQALDEGAKAGRVPALPTRPVLLSAPPALPTPAADQ